MHTPIPPTLNDLTQATMDGAGVFDTMMRANRAHLENEFKLGRIKGPEYATVYLGALQTMMNGAIQFLLSKDKAAMEAELVAQQILLTKAQTALSEQQRLNAIAEHAVLVAQECKLRAEFDVIMLTKDKTAAETGLLNQKTATERAQTQALGVDADSIVGRQKGLYLAQSDGFKRDAEQKATKILVDTWNARRMTDEATQANATNLLDDTTIGRTVNKLLAGVGA